MRTPYPFGASLGLISGICGGRKKKQDKRRRRLRPVTTARSAGSYGGLGCIKSGVKIRAELSSLRSLFQRGYCRKENQGVTQGICTAFCGFGFAVLEKVPSRTAVLMTKR